MASGSQDENEKPAKVWQVNEVSAKIDTLTSLVQAQTETYYTQAQVDLLILGFKNELAGVKKTLANIIRVVWIVVGTVVPIAVATVWQLVVNNARVE